VSPVLVYANGHYATKAVNAKLIVYSFAASLRAVTKGVNWSYAFSNSLYCRVIAMRFFA